MTTFIDRPVSTQADTAGESGVPSKRASFAAEAAEFGRLLQKWRRIYGWATWISAIVGVLVLGEGFRRAGALSEGKVADTQQNLFALFAIVALFMFMCRVEATDRYRRRRAIALQIVDVLDDEQQHEAVAEETVDLDGLLKTNRTLLRQYHSISTEQAQEAFKMARLVVGVAGVVFLLACGLALYGETVVGVSLAGAAVIASGVGGWVSRTFLESYRISVAQAEAYFREPMVQGYLLAAHQIAQTMETPSARDQGLSRVMDGFLAAGLECARSRSSAVPGAHPES